jgi:tetratricopeptide (TPR) repeat protein
MFLKKLFTFGKDYNHYLEKADRYLADERFADARIAYVEALEKIEAGSGEGLHLANPVRQKIALTGNMLGRLNLVEAEYALSSGDGKKAGEHLQVIMDLADDATLRENAERLLAELASGPSKAPQGTAAHACISCAGKGLATVDEDYLDVADTISREDRLSLYFQTLPEELSGRYAAMGEEFARGCLLNLDGDEEGALRAFEDVPADRENDILNYEKGILYFHQGDAVKCEQLLLKAIGFNPVNPLCHIGLVHLYAETGREPEALQVLEGMIARDLIPEQSRLLQGDLYSQMQDETKALECYSMLLASSQIAKDAAGRIIPILEKQGRSKEAAFLVKKYVKGCC